MLAQNHRQGSERRRTPRVAVRRYAEIAFHGRSLPCHVIDESSGGVRLADFSVQSCPDEFLLHVGDGEPRRCRVAWRSQEAVGVRYLVDERVRRLRQNIARYGALLLAGPGSEEAAVYQAEIAAAQAMLDELLPHGNALADEDNASD